VRAPWHQGRGGSLDLRGGGGQDAAEAKLEAVLRGMERGQAGSSGVKAES